MKKNLTIAALLGYIATGFGTAFRGEPRAQAPSFYTNRKSPEEQIEAIATAQEKRDRKNKKRLSDMGMS